MAFRDFQYAQAEAPCIPDTRTEFSVYAFKGPLMAIVSMYAM